MTGGRFPFHWNRPARPAPGPLWPQVWRLAVLACVCLTPAVALLAVVGDWPWPPWK